MSGHRVLQVGDDSCRALAFHLWALRTSSSRVPSVNPGLAAASRSTLAPLSLLGVEQDHVEVAAGLVDDALAQARDGAADLGPVGADDEVRGEQRGGVGHRGRRIARRSGARRLGLRGRADAGRLDAATGRPDCSPRGAAARREACASIAASPVVGSPLVVALVVLAVVELGLSPARSSTSQAAGRGAGDSQLVWVCCVVLVQLIGPIVYLAVGRVRAGAGGEAATTPAPRPRRARPLRARRRAGLARGGGAPCRRRAGGAAAGRRGARGRRRRARRPSARSSATRSALDGLT